MVISPWKGTHLSEIVLSLFPLPKPSLFSCFRTGWGGGWEIWRKFLAVSLGGKGGQGAEGGLWFYARLPHLSPYPKSLQFRRHQKKTAKVGDYPFPPKCPSSPKTREWWLPPTTNLVLTHTHTRLSLSIYVCMYMYIYIWQLGHLLPSFCSKCHFFPSFIAKMAQKNLSIYGQIFCIFWILSKCTFNQFLEDIRMWAKKTSFGGNIKCILGKICFWLGKC